MTLRGLTLALTLFGTALFTATMLIIQGATYLANMPNSRGSLYWIILLIMVPAVATGITSGLTAGLGAYIGTRMSTSETGAPVDRKRMSVGAGLGGALGSTLFLMYLSWSYQNGPGLLVGVLGFIVVFGAYAGFTALWSAHMSLLG